MARRDFIQDAATSELVQELLAQRAGEELFGKEHAGPGQLARTLIRTATLAV